MRKKSREKVARAKDEFRLRPDIVINKPLDRKKKIKVIRHYWSNYDHILRKYKFPGYCKEYGEFKAYVNKKIEAFLDA